jgi:hypothetical protein
MVLRSTGTRHAIQVLQTRCEAAKRSAHGRSGALVQGGLLAVERELVAACGQEPVCAPCRYVEKPIDEATLERMRRWWLSKYSIDELLEIGRMIGWC